MEMSTFNNNLENPTEYYHLNRRCLIAQPTDYSNRYLWTCSSDNGNTVFENLIEASTSWDYNYKRVVRLLDTCIDRNNRVKRMRVDLSREIRIVAD